MDITVTVNEEDLKNAVERQILKSDLVEEMIEDILRRHEIEELITDKVKEVIQSDEIKFMLIKKAERYVTEEYDISNETDVVDVLNECLTEVIKSKFEQ